MTQEEILEYNKRCAEFLGYVNTTPTDKDFNIYENKDGKMLEVMSMVFHSDWNWIIEVVEAIERIGETSNKYGVLVDITTTHVRIGNFLVDLKLTPMPKKEAIVQAINQFLIWYNEQTN